MTATIMTTNGNHPIEQHPVDQGLAENLRLSADLAAVIILTGARQHDRFITVNEDGKPNISRLEGAVWSALKSLTALWCYDPAKGIPALFRVREGANLSGELPVQIVPADKFATDKGVEKHNILPAFLSMTEAGSDTSRMALLIDGSFLWEDAAHPRETDHALLQAIDLFSRSQLQSRKLLILRTSNLSSVPPALTGSPSVRVVPLPDAGRDERTAYMQIRGLGLAQQCSLDISALAKQVAGVTDDWRLEDIEGLIRTCQQQQIQSPTELEATARAFRMGVARSPWAGSEIRAAITVAPTQLSQRVRGQPVAIEAVCRALRKASSGLSGAHQSGVSRGPRATLFFAGPTGTGKTEAAKAIAQLVYGDDSALVRFDCAEFRQDHAVARLIGAPPGYVGYEAGGELTDRIITRPHSVLLFDEIEKAHPRLLDLFLSILDDGRLTNGQGLTANFGETILIFTSNLGIYEEVIDTTGNAVRRPRFDYNATYEQILLSVQDAIREEFISVIGRPELLGRLGGERALIVFDYLRDLRGVTKKFIDNITTTVARLHGVDLVIDDSVVTFIAEDTAAQPSALALGARGLAQSLDSHFTEPLADFIFQNRLQRCQIKAAAKPGEEIAFSSMASIL